MKSLAEYFQAFDSYAVENDLSANSRTLYYTLLGMFNEKFWKVESVSISVRDMQVRGGFQSSSAVERAKTILGTENIVKIDKLKNRKTQYVLVDPQFWLRNSSKTVSPQFQNACGTLKEQLQNTCGTSPFINYTLNDAQKEDVKTLREEDRITSAETASAGAMLFNKSELSKELARAWLENVGEMPRGGIWLKLLELEQERGTKALVDVINKAAIHNTEPRISLAYIMRILENKERGEMQNGKTGDVERFDEKSRDRYNAAFGFEEGD